MRYCSFSLLGKKDRLELAERCAVELGGGCAVGRITAARMTVVV